MKTLKIFALTVITALAFNACQDDVNSVEVEKGMKNFRITTSVPQMLKTYASENGGALNVDPASVDLRYILEVWTKEATPRLAYRSYILVDDDFTQTAVTFEMQLLAMEYDFVFWADFVPQSAVTTYGLDAKYEQQLVDADWVSARKLDWFYTTSDGKTEDEIKADPANADAGLTHITMKDKNGVYQDINRDERDAWYKTVTVDLTTTDQVGNVVLNRPFGKFRVIATDAIDGYLKSVESSTLVYDSGEKFYQEFNALTGEVDIKASFLAPNTGTTKTGIAAEEVKKLDGSVLAAKGYVLAFDYVFAPDGKVVNFELTATSGDGYTVSRTFTNIPLGENKLTTIVGNFFSQHATMEVIVEDEFEEEIIYDPSTQDPGVEINGVVWATRNVGEPGKFAADENDPGYLYQWGSNVAYKIVYDAYNARHYEAVDGVSTFDDTWALNGATTWANNICPPGWRLPTMQEWLDLIMPHMTVNGDGILCGGMTKIAIRVDGSIDKGTDPQGTAGNPVLQKGIVVDDKSGNEIILWCNGMVSRYTPNLGQTYTDGGTATIYGVNKHNNANGSFEGYYWSSNLADNGEVYSLKFDNTGISQYFGIVSPWDSPAPTLSGTAYFKNPNNYKPSAAFSVRCVKE